ncbi:hypothetical protein TWF506_004285 [Arthrobotrys conoides]|uniref:Uncharacterized protein n=1 Tax=Arthrobotrys conoides TaxID=74498 RepID=A0AAN8RTF7_9PEZI
MAKVKVPEPVNGFNPHTSPLDDLDRAGYTPRPDPPRVNNSLGLYEARNWSGGVLPVRPQVYNPCGIEVLNQEDPFDHIFGSWIIPNLHPRKHADGRVKDGDYELYTWVGLDGWESNETLKVDVVLGT